MTTVPATACTAERVQAWRARRYRRRPDLRLRTPQQAVEFVDDVGFCFLFPAKGIEMPSLWEAICGESRPLPRHHDDRELGCAWRWKDDLPSRGLVYYGKLLRKKPMLISLELLPHFYALSENFGSLEDYLTEYEEGRLSEEAKRVYEALLTHGALPTSHLRRRAGLSGKDNAPRFDRAVLELQVGLKIVKTGVSDANAWKYCYVYDILQRHWPDLPERAAAIARDEAMRTLLLKHLRNAGLMTVKNVMRLFGWEEWAFNPICEELTATHQLVAGVRVEGWSSDSLAWPGLLEVCS